MVRKTCNIYPSNKIKIRNDVNNHKDDNHNSCNDDDDDDRVERSFLISSEPF